MAKGEKRKKGEPPPPPFRLLLEDGTALPLPPKFRRQRTASLLEKAVTALFWPSTDEEGLVKELHLGHLSPLESQGPQGRPTFLVRGRLLLADRDRARVAVEVRPNPRGTLKEAFTLTLWASLSALEALPPVGSGVELRGSYAPSSRRLVVREARAVRLWDDPRE